MTAKIYLKKNEERRIKSENSPSKSPRRGDLRKYCAIMPKIIIRYD